MIDKPLRIVGIPGSLRRASFNRGLLVAGRAGEARSHLERALDLKPDFFEAHLHLGRLLARGGDAAGATRHLERAAAGPDAEIRREAGELLERTRRR